jgi:hypothetical protein
VSDLREKNISNMGGPGNLVPRVCPFAGLGAGHAYHEYELGLQVVFYHQLSWIVSKLHEKDIKKIPVT